LHSLYENPHVIPKRHVQPTPPSVTAAQVSILVQVSPPEGELDGYNTHHLSALAFATGEKMVCLALETYRCCGATLGWIRCWATCLSRCPFVDTGITILTTSSSTAASNCTAPTHARTVKGRYATAQERTNANRASLCFNLVYRKEKEKQYG
jgi:hypothetical protein